MKKLVSLCCCMMLFFVGCPKAAEFIMTGASVVLNAGAILTPINHEYGDMLTTAGHDLQLLSTLMQDYSAAPTASKAERIHSLVASVTQHLAEVLAAVAIKNPQAKAYVGVAVAIANTVLMAVVKKLPPAPPTAAALPVLPSIQATDAEGLKKAWNEAVKVEHPEAMVR